jgi:peptidoglycan/xylan/chitin deacetylase (PgdA/CDA1 family)
MQLPVLLYHHVGPTRPGTLPDLTISPEKFERQVHWLARRGFVGIRPSDWLRWLRDGTGLPDKPILFTFDDGYADIADYALAVLRRHGFSAAVYIVTGQLGGTNAWDEEQGSGTHRLMTVEQIRHWAGQGIEFGAHSKMHSDLTKLSATELVAEISGSKNDLASVLGSPVVSFAYPFGELSEDVSEVVRGEFDLAFTTERGLNYLRTDPHLLRRINISPNDSLIDIEIHSHWGELQHVNQLRARLKVRSRLKRAARFVLRRR